MTHLKNCQIPEQLRPFVKAIYLMQAPGTWEPPPHSRVLPDGCVELFVNIGDTADSFEVNGRKINGSSFITSRMNCFMDISSPKQVHFITVWFYPGRSWPFFDVPMSIVANQTVCLSDIGKSQAEAAKEMEQRVEATLSDEEKVQVVQEFLIEKLSRNYRAEESFQSTLTLIEKSLAQVSVDSIARAVGLSHRQLLRKYDQCLGLGPKEYIKMRRFLSASELLKVAKWSLTDVAYETGYFDQAHFIHDAKQFSGMTPGELRQAKNVLF
ncbi:MAG: helix-turn-helix domain-containing protein [Imperialibacter sp.]|uniref:helix-turn-helix domain-containing protein n=1 Tax=Imperialibacter sp. TaxID=2038411 RepID=UPI003A894A07